MSKDNVFGEYLRKVRQEKNFSINGLAKKSGISNAQISRIESGARGVPKPETIEKLANALNVSYVEMMVVAGYWDEEDLLEPLDKNKLNKNKRTPSQNEKEFLKKLELSDDKLLEEFELTLDGETISEEEAKGVIAYLRSLRSMKKE